MRGFGNSRRLNTGQLKASDAMVHLSITSLMAGNTFCGLGRLIVSGVGEEVVHPNVHLLSSPSYRNKICSECLAVWDNPEIATNPAQSIPLQGVVAADN